jgi:hypothetical protein
LAKRRPSKRKIERHLARRRRRKVTRIDDSAVEFLINFIMVYTYIIKDKNAYSILNQLFFFQTLYTVELL